ncbi:hypothetical protein D3C73_1542880 [compost metagenome]
MLCGAQQHGGMGVMAAQMRHALDVRPIGQIVLLLDGKRIEIRPQADRSAAVPDL